MDSSKRVSCTNCCVVGCSNNYTNTDKTVKFYRFPSRPHEHERRMRWIQAVKRKVSPTSDKAWEPKSHSRICSKHFTGDAKSNHPDSPSYVPTIFPQPYKKQCISNVEEKTARFSRLMQRQKNTPLLPSKIKSVDQEQDIHLNCDNEVSVTDNVAPMMVDFSAQVNFGIDNTFFTFDCEHQPNNTVLTSCNIRRDNSIKFYVEKSVGPESAEEICTGFHGITSVTTDDQLISLCSVKFSVFALILSFLQESSHGNNKIKMENRLLLFLMKMKLGLSYVGLATLFGIHRNTVQRIFTSILNELVQKMKYFVSWPSKEVILKCMPNAFKVHYADCRVIIDCTEFKIQQPSSVDNRIFTYSQYKGSFTAKCLIGITPNGFISFLSKCYGGRSSDAFITNDSGILNLLEPGDIVLADKGFPGIQTKEGTIIVMPPFLHDGHLTLEEVEETYHVASVRIHVERAIQRVKLHGILNNFTNDLLPYVDDIVFMCCALANLQPPIIKQCKHNVD